ncbi:MAG: GNAT family N-acetyltransferase [Candidatus Bathyarchaeota archaeon]|nr:GNAT family N-acetyltransferase [Candidatus Bathyarchaeota archaeon]
MQLTSDLCMHWSRILGLPITRLEKSKVEFISVSEQIQVPLGWLLLAVKVNEACVIIVDQERIDEAKQIFSELTVKEIFTEVGAERIKRFFEIEPERIAHHIHLYCDREHFRSVKNESARRLMPYGSDREICMDWRSKYPRAINPYTYEEANPVSYGVIIDGELASLSVVWRYDLPFWEIGVETAPDYRMRGYAKSVVSLATEEVMAAARIPWYKVDANPLNIASLKVSKALGYVEYMESLNYKLKAQQ